MDREKEIEALAHLIFECVDREFIDKFIEDENGDLASIQTVSIYSIAEHLLNNGYSKNADVWQGENEVRREAFIRVIDDIKAAVARLERLKGIGYADGIVIGLKRAIEIIIDLAKSLNIEV